MDVATDAHFTLNARPLADLQRAAKADGAGSLKAVAKQFESMFLGMMMKSMRAGSGNGDSPFDNESSKLFTEMLDQEYSQKIANGRGMGLADALVAQLSRPKFTGVDLDKQAKAIPLHPETQLRAYSQGLPGAAQTPITLPQPAKPQGIPLNHPLRSGVETGGKLLGSA